MNGDIARLGDGIGIRLAEVEFVAAVGLGLDGAAHGVGHGHLSVFRRGHGKGQGAGGKFAQRDGLVHIGINGDAPRLGLVAELADGVGIGTGGNGVCAVLPVISAPLRSFSTTVAPAGVLRVRV